MDSKYDTESVDESILDSSILESVILETQNDHNSHNSHNNHNEQSSNENKEENKQKKKKEECSVCISSKIKIIKCPYCLYISCNDCNEKYFLESVNKPHCMSCKKEFSNAFFYNNFSKAFINKRYKIHREQILYEREKYLLPATQPEVEKIYKKEKLQKQIMDIRVLIHELKVQEDSLRHKMITLDIKDEKDEKTERDHYVCPCPNNDCRGFLSTKYKCGICNAQACSDCREIKKDNHECDPNILESVKEIKKTTRDCPNCRTLIFKISGCDQMYCTQCHIAFSWRTGKVEKGLIHNPHYFEYLRNNGEVPRNPNEDRCGGLPHTSILFQFRYKQIKPISHVNKVYSNLEVLLTAIYRQVRHLREVELRALPTMFDNQTNLDLRISFLLKEITEDEFKVKLQRREKERNKKLEYREVIDLYVNVMQDLFYELDRTKNYEKFLIQEEDLRSYADKGISDINRIYDSKLKSISSFFI